MEGGTETPKVRFDFELPDELQGGVYANLLNVWHTPYEFTLDFSVIQPTTQQPVEGEVPVIPARVVARMRIPPSIVFEVLKALNCNMTRYEAKLGPSSNPR